jgi:hypothetical protein
VPVSRHADPVRLLVLLGMQLALALLMSASPAVATLHVVLTVGVAAVAILSRRVEVIVVVAAYIVGVENLWRITGATMPYLLPSYLLLALLLGVPRSRGRGLLTVMPLVLLGVLLPSAVATFLDIGVGEGRERVAFTVVPLVVLVVAVIRFSGYRITDEFRRRVVAAIVVPTAGIAFVVLARTPTIADIEFGSSSSFLTSGGFGPNRVAASLGLGALLCVLEALRERRPLFLVIELGLAVWFTGQSVLTFSRGGVLSVVIALAAGFLYIGARRGQVVQSVVVVGGTAALLLFVVFPRLDASTGGALNERFSDVETERSSLAGEDLALFRAEPLLGVGAGEAAFARSGGAITPSHTEFTRLLAEHGLFGAVGILLLLAMTWIAVRQTPVAYKSYCITLVVWCLTQMAYANLRLSAVAFLFGFACLRPTDARAVPASLESPEPVQVPSRS